MTNHLKAAIRTMNKELKTFQAYLNWAPISLSIREVSRISALRLLKERYGFSSDISILDVGCGDGHWWKSIDFFQANSVSGIDISGREIALANSIIDAKKLDITDVEFPHKLGKKFDLVIGNCSLEHVPKLDEAIHNIKSVLKTGGTIIFFVPTPDWALKGNIMKLLGRISPRLSMAASGAMNGFFQHWHLYPYKTWERVLEAHGFTSLTSFGLGNRKTEFLFRLFLPTAFLSFIIKCVTGKYLNYFIGWLVPGFIKRWLSEAIIRRLDSELRTSTSDSLFEYIIVGKNE